MPVALTRGSGKRRALLTAGAAHVIVTEEQDLVAEVKNLTGGKGARIVFDPVGGPTLAKLTAAMAERGILFLYGALSTKPTLLPLMDVLSKSLTIRGYVLFEISGDPQRLERAKKFIVDGLAAGKLKPVVAKTFPLDQIVEAHRYLEFEPANRQDRGDGLISDPPWKDRCRTWFRLRPLVGKRSCRIAIRSV